MATLNLSILIRAIDRATAPIRAVSGGLRGQLGPALERVTGVSSRMTAALGRVTGALGGRLISALGRVTAVAAKATAGLAALVGARIGALGAGVIRTGAQFEMFAARLENMEGSAEAARRSMAWVTQFAARTPYEIAEVMEAFVALKGLGIDPTQGALQALGEGAAGTGKSLSDMTGALADAQEMQFERLRELNIAFKTEGERVTFTYGKLGQRISVTAARNSDAVRTALTGIFNDRFGGMMEAQANTMTGIVSGLKDQWTGFLRLVGDQGVFSFVRDELKGLLGFLSSDAGKVRLTEWAKQIGAELLKLAKTIKGIIVGVDWSKFIASIVSAVDGVSRFMKSIGGLSGILTGAGLVAIVMITGSILGLATTMATTSAAVALAGGVMGAGIATAIWPITLTIAAIGALAAAAFLIYRNWGGITAFFGRLWSSVISGVSGAWSKIVGGVTDAIGAIGGFAAAMARGLGRMWGGVVLGAANAWSSIVSSVTGAVGAIGGLFSDMARGLGRMWGGVVSGASDAWSGIVASVAGAADAISEQASGIGGALGRLWGSMAARAAAAWAGITGFFGRMFDRLKGVFATGVSLIWSILPACFEGCCRARASSSAPSLRLRSLPPAQPRSRGCRRRDGKLRRDAPRRRDARHCPQRAGRPSYRVRQRLADRVARRSGHRSTAASTSRPIPACAPHLAASQQAPEAGSPSTRIAVGRAALAEAPHPTASRPIPRYPGLRGQNFSAPPISVSKTRCVVPLSDGASSILTREEEDALWQAFFTAAPARRRVFEPSSKRRKRAPVPLPPATV